VNGGNIDLVPGALVGTALNGKVRIAPGVGTPAGGVSSGTIAARTALTFGSSFVGIYIGSGAPTLTAAQGSLYIRTDNGANTSLYVNRDAGTTWAAVTSA
jgi:hypothetical protein